MSGLVYCSHSKEQVERYRRVLALVMTVMPLALWATGCSRQSPSPAHSNRPVKTIQGRGGTQVSPLPDAERKEMARLMPLWAEFADRVRDVYAALPSDARGQVQSNGECTFSLLDLPKAQADVIRELVEKDRSLHATLEGWVGAPLDPSKVTFVFSRQGDRLHFGYRGNGNAANWAPIGIWKSP